MNIRFLPTVKGWLMVVALLAGLPHLYAAESFNPFSYGALGNGTILDTIAVQRAIDAAASAGNNSQVVIPQGFTFLVGTLVLRSGIDFELDGDLIASTNHADYLGDALLTASNVMNLTINGAGSITGRALSFMTNYDRAGECWQPAPWRPKMFSLVGCTNMTVRDITFGDAPGRGLYLLGCRNVLVDHVTVRNRLNVPDCDGIVPDHCQHMEIRNCDVLTGDDAIVIKTTRQPNDYGPSTYIYVHDCTLQSQSTGLNIGAETVSDIHDILYERCRVTSAGRGLGIQLRDEGSVSNVVYRNLEFNTRYFPDPWRGYGEGISLTAIPRTAATKIGLMQNILFTNVSGRAENSLRINGTADSHIRDVRLQNVAVTLDRWTKYAGGRYDNRPTETPPAVEAHVTAGLNIRYADGVVLKDVTVRWGKNSPAYFTYALETDHVTGLELWDFKGLSAHPGKYQDMLMR